MFAKTTSGQIEENFRQDNPESGDHQMDLDQLVETARQNLRKRVAKLRASTQKSMAQFNASRPPQWLEDRPDWHDLDRGVDMIRDHTANGFAALLELPVSLLRSATAAPAR